MKKLNSNTVLMILLLVSLFSCTSESNYSQDVQEKILAVENGLASFVMTKEQPSWSLGERMAHYKVQGLSIAVINDYKVQWAKAYGFANGEKQEKATINTLFQAASMSKSINAMALLKLAQTGKIKLDTDINEYLTSWKFPYEPDSKPITITHLLSHTAGLNVHGFPGYASDESLPSAIQILNGEAPSNTEAIKSLYDPGMRFQYSGGGILITQLIVEDVAAMPYEQFMKEEVLTPLGMKQSTFSTLNVDSDQLLATAYEEDGSAVKGQFHRYPEMAAAGLWTTPTEFAQYIIETQLSGENKSSKVLNSEFTGLMLNPYLTNGNTGLGTFIERHGDNFYFNHSGANWGFNCNSYGSIEGGKGVVIMVNSFNSDILAEVVTSVALAYNWDGFEAPEIKTHYDIANDQLQEYLGEYYINEQVQINITAGDKLLMLALPGRPAFEIYPEAKDKFYPTTLPGQIEFIRNDKNEITQLIIHANGNATSAVKQ